MPLVCALGSAAAGITADKVIDLDLNIWLAAAGLALAVWTLSVWRSTGVFAQVFLMLSVAALGGAWHHAYWNLFPADDLGYFANADPQPVCLRARIVSAPTRLRETEDPLATLPAGDQTRCVLRAEALRTASGWHQVTGRCSLIVSGHLPAARVGDRIEVLGQLQRPRQAMNPGGYSPYEQQRWQRRLAHIIAKYPQAVQTIGTASKLDPRWMLARTHHHCCDTLYRYLGPSEGDLAAAILVGARAQLDRERTDQFLVTGTIHVLSISGLHVGILAAAVFFLANMLSVPRRATLIFVMVMITGFAILTGGRAPVVRATILVWVVCWEWLLHRRSPSFNALSAAGLVVLAANPTELFQTGAQLSFLSVAALIWTPGLAQVLRRRGDDALAQLKRRTSPLTLPLLSRYVGRMALAGCTIWLATLPLIAHQFHVVSPIAVVLNLFLSFPLAVSLLSGMGTLLFAWILPPMAALLSAACSLGLQSMEGFVQLTYRIPGGFFWVAGPGLATVLFFYAGLGLGTSIRRWQKRWYAWLAVLYVLFLGGWGLSYNDPGGRTPSGPFTCTFLSVGHGTCVVCELPGGETWLYDAGRLGSPQGAVDEISSYLWKRGITNIHRVILSHADADHFNALPGLLERFRVGTVCVSPTMFQGTNHSVRELRERLEAAGILIERVVAGTRLASTKDVQIHVLHPPVVDDATSDNSSSIVLSVTIHGRRILLTGDLEGRGLQQLLATEPLDCDLALAPHHGSQRSQPPRFCAWSTPEWIVISGGRGDRASAAQALFESQGPDVLHTASRGAIRAQIDRIGVRVSAWRDRRTGL
jgi:competence protein ComEC